jgi:flagellar motor switch protein FliM
MAMGAFAEWTLLLAVQNDRLDALLPGATSARPAAARSRQAGEVEGGPFAALPMRLEAVLGEVELPLARLGTLAPGDELAFTIPRELALRIGEDVFAHGTPGTLDNRMALRLTRVPHRISPSVEEEPAR